MLSPFLGFTERDIIGVYAVNSATASGVIVSLDATNSAPLNPTPYGNQFGDVVAASITTSPAGQRELGFLLQPVTTNGPSLLSILAQVYDESIPAGAVAAVLFAKTGNQVATDQYVASGTGAISFSGSTALNTPCGIASGLYRVAQAGDVNRALFMGAVNQRGSELAVFQIN